MEQAEKAGIPRMKELVGILKRADTAYYKHDDPIMTDREYDALFDELKMLEDNSGIVLSGSPTQKVSGEILEGLTEVEHTRPMLSAAKTKSVDEIVRFIGSRAALVSWKLDGLTLVLRYEDGKLKQAITRGAEGRIGEDVTHTVRVILNVPLTIPYTQPLEVRGEGVVGWANFEQLNGELDEPYTHPRSLAAGSIRKLDATKVKNRMLEFVAFDLISGDSFTMKHEQLAFLSKLGFDVVYHLPLGDLPTEPQIRAVIDWFKPENVVFDYFYCTPEKVLTKGAKMIDCYVIKSGFDPYLKRWLQQRKDLSINSEWLFVTKTDKGYEQASAETLNSWAQTIDRFTVKPFYWHSMRHLFVSNLVRDGMSESDITDVVGWANSAMVQVYNDVPASERLSKFFENKRAAEAEEAEK